MKRLVEYLAVTAIGVTGALWVATEAASYTSSLIMEASNCLEDPLSCNTEIGADRVKATTTTAVGWTMKYQPMSIERHHHV